MRFYTKHSILLLLAVSVPCLSSPKDFCNEIDLNPDLTVGNKRIFINPHALGCDLGFSLPGLGKLNVGKAICDKVESKTNSLLKSTFDKLDAELGKINASAEGEFNKIKGMDFSGEKGASSVGSGDSGYNPGNFQTTIDGETYRVDITEEDYQNAINSNALQKSIENRKSSGTAVKPIPNKKTAAGPAAGPSPNSPQATHSGYFD